jgi:catechol 2,3-dioxygenase-like lactoylglutathione lyase family enzyme
MRQPTEGDLSMSTDVRQAWILREIAPIEPGIVCIDIERMIRFYTGVLGLKLINDAETTPEMSTKFGTTPEGYRIVRLQTALGQKVKLVQPPVPPMRNPLPEWVYQRQGIAYLTFVVADVNEVVTRLKEHGVRMVSQGIVEVRKGILAIYTLDPEDNYVEFVEFPTQREMR